MRPADCFPTRGWKPPVPPHQVGHVLSEPVKDAFGQTRIVSHRRTPLALSR